MAFSFRAAGAPTVGNNTTTHSVALPPGTAAGDLLLAFISVAQGGSGFTQPTITTPAGWTQLGSTLTNQTTNAGIVGAVYYRWATGSDTGPTWTFNASVLFKHAAIVAGWKGGPGSGAPTGGPAVGNSGSATLTNTAATVVAANQWFAEFFSSRSTTNGSYSASGSTFRASDFGTGGAAADLLLLGSNGAATGTVAGDTATADTAAAWSWHATILFPTDSAPVSLALPHLTVSVAAPTPQLSIPVTVALPAVTVTIRAQVPAVLISTVVALPHLTVTVTAPAMTVSAAVNPAVVLALPVLTVTISTPGMDLNIVGKHIFRPPTYKQRPADPQGERLWLYYGIDTGISVLKDQDGNYRQTTYPSTDEIDEAAITYLGGHEYEVSDEEYFALVAAGFLSGFDDSSQRGYGEGVYGINPYGS